MFIAIVDLERAYNTVSRGKLWKVPEEYTICGKLLTAIRALHDGSQACVRGGSRMSQWFEVRQGVRQGCVQLNKNRIISMCAIYAQQRHHNDSHALCSIICMQCLKPYILNILHNYIYTVP